MSYKIKIAILGSTGSIGLSTIETISENLNLFQIEILSCNKNFLRISKQIKNLNPKNVIISDYKTYLKKKKKFSKKKINFFNNFKDIKLKKKIDITVCAISGILGLQSTFLFLKFSKKLLIANKESIVCGGQFLLKQAKKNFCKIISIDSELYCLDLLLKKYSKTKINKVYITASGGPFLNKKNLKNVSVKDALKHPTWKMGKKISIDSATLVNKIFEMIEVKTLYNIPFESIKIKIHPQSKIHALCILDNGIVDFIAHNTDMKIPIRNTIFNKIKKNSYIKNFIESSGKINLELYECIPSKFPILRLGYTILKLGDIAHIAFNVFNDFFVEQFLVKKISFIDISKNIITLFDDKELLRYCKTNKIKNFNDIFKVISYSKQLCSNLMLKKF